MDARRTFLHNAFNLFEKTRILLVDPLGQITAVIHDLEGKTLKAISLVKCD